ncbi:cold adaptation protein AtcC [Shewanella polaris]|uniref:Uncharacterized protein n=1 Tax=Shewanella polaris TaxID=2588449 RepID=A0A4Y5YCC2_9GAMM|nr:hypothetical protein [Shewanella polaris]QDE30267.1 hypothetical protein FH971_04345 [Shewanella polaris]
MQLALRDSNQGPYLTKVLAYGQLEDKLSQQELTQIKAKAILMSLKLADKFYNKHKMHLLEQAAHDVIGVVSIGLISLTGNEPATSLPLLQTSDGVLKCFQKGWSLLTQASSLNTAKSLYGDVSQSLLEKVSSPPDMDEWQGWQSYQEALAEHDRLQAISVLLKTFYQNSNLDLVDCLNIEAVLAEAVLYRTLFADSKVREDLKKRLGKIELDDAWFDSDYLMAQTDKTLALLPADLVVTIRSDLSKHYNQGLLRTMHFAKGYRELLMQGASPEKLERFEHKEGLNGLLGWPHYIDL